MNRFIVGLGQTIFDVAILCTGNIENVFDIIIFNDLDFNADLIVGQEILIPDDIVINYDVVNYFKKSKIEVSTEFNGIVSSSDITINNSDNSFAVTVNDDYQLPDIELSVGGVILLFPSAVDISIESQSNPVKTGETVSYLSGDDGDIQAGRELDFYTLTSNNPFGNNIRFTNDMGGIVFDGSDGSTPDYVVDNATRLGWKQSLPTGFPNYTNQLNYAASLVVGSYNAFRLANLNEYVTVVNDSLGIFRPDNTIFTFTGSYSWINQMQNSSTAYRAIYNSSISQRGIYSGDANARGMYCRNHTY